MLNPIKLNILPVAVLLLLPCIAKAETPSLTRPFSIDSLVVNSGTSPHPGDTVHLMVYVHAFASGAAYLHLHFPNFVAPPDQGSGETQRDSLITVDSGSTYSYSVPLKLFSYGGSIVEASVSTANIIPGFERFAYGFVEIEHSPSSFAVRSSSGPKTKDSVTMATEGLTHGYGTLTLSGNVYYVDPNIKDPHDPFSNLKKGTSRVKVVVLFTKGGITGGFGSTTPFYQPWNGCVENVDWQQVDMDGNFNITYTNGPYDWTYYTNAVILVTTSNDATHVVGGGVYPISIFKVHPMTSTCDDWETFDLTHAKVIPITDPHTIYQTGIKIPINFPEGSALRNEELAWKFDQARASITPPQILTQILGPIDAVPGNFNKFPLPSPPQDHINLFSLYTDHEIDHEYGHFAQWTLQLNSWGAGDWTHSAFRNFAEGFAEFHQFAVRNYASSTFGDISDWTSGNDEEAPFISGSGRFGGVYGGTTSVAIPACFIWNVYDGYSDAGYKATQYAADNNDDIGLPSLIFDYLRYNSGEPNLDGTYGYMSFLDANANSAWPSVQSIYSCMTGSGTTLMRPAQVKNVDGQVSLYHDYRTDFSWDWQSYSSSGFANLPAGVHISQSNGSGGWHLVATTVYPSSSTEFYSDPTLPYHFKVTAYNSSGDSYGEVIIDPPALKPSARGSSIAVNDPLSVSAYPNPTPGSTSVNVTALSGGLPAVVKVYDILDNEIATLYEGTPAGDMGLRLTFDGSHLAAGTYYIRAQNAIMGGMVKLQVVH